MIIDSLNNANLYYGLGERIKSALAFIQKNDFSNMEPGKYEIDGTNIFALLQSYETKAKGKGLWEAHRKYIDIQYVYEGSEQMGYRNIENMKVSKEYDADGDYMLLEGEGNFLQVGAGYFAIFYPDDVHMPGIAAENPEKIKKVVVKVLAG